MKSRLFTQLALIFLVLMVGTFDRHLSGYFNGEVKALIQSDPASAHNNNLDKFCDHHEDFTSKITFCAVPEPESRPVFHANNPNSQIPGNPPQSIWQPPEGRT
jgi:hypothetical protein